MNLDFGAFMDTLPVMLYGMLGIFVVMLAVFALVSVFAKVTAGKRDQ